MWINNVFSRIKQYGDKPSFFFERPWIVILLNVVISALMLVLYEPFGYKLQNWSQLGELLGFTFIAFCYSFLSFYLFPRWFGIYKSPEKWTVAKNLLLLSTFLLLTGISIFLYDYHIISGYTLFGYGGRYFKERLFTDVFGVFSIGIFPLYVSYLLEKNYVLRKHLDETIYMVEKSEYKQLENKLQIPLLVLTGDTKDSLEVSPDCICYLESSGNYVNVYYYEEGKIVRKTIRTTIKKVEEQLVSYDYLLRCHRMYIVNTHWIVRFGRIEQGYRISLQDCMDEIPVSRTYLPHIKEVMHI